MTLDTLLQATGAVGDPDGDVLARARPSFDLVPTGDPAVLGLDRARRRRRALAVTGIAAAAAAGLVAVPVLGRGPTGSTANAAEIVRAAGLGDPVARAQDSWRLDSASQELVQRCMTARGLTYYPTVAPYPTAPPAGDDLLPTADGYGLQQHLHDHEAQLRNREDDYTATLTPAQSTAYDEAYFGPDSARVDVRLPGGGTVQTGSEGCLADARTQLYGSVTAEAVHDALPQAVSGEILAAATHDGSYQAALHGWAACLRTVGFADASPGAAIGRLAGEYTAGDPSLVQREEAREAQADLHCDGSGLRATLAQARLRATAHVPVDQRAQLLASDAVREAAVARARAVVGR